MKYDNQLRYSTHIIESYRGSEPLHVWLKDFYKSHPQMGSTDRRQVREMVYSYYRLGHTLPQRPIQERILLGLFLTGDSPDPILAYFRPAWNEASRQSLVDKIEIAKAEFPRLDIAGLFPWMSSLSDGIDQPLFTESFLRQPDLFIRLRPGHEEPVRRALREASVRFTEPAPSTLAFESSTRLEQWIKLNQVAVIQDYSSQRTAAFFGDKYDAGAKAWDCCAASGGKSILLYDRFPDISITVSDIRKSILQQLKIRFNEAGIKNYRSLEIDLTKADPLPGETFDLILIDAPCTGSGTWSRTPESLLFFDPAKELVRYSALQRSIISRVAPKLKAHGRLVYITCSVFREENEDAVEYIRKELGFTVIEQQMITGYTQKADSMFVASFAAG